MNGAVGDDMYITGGSITMSEYEQNMTPQDQKEYENTLMDLFQSAYKHDSLIASGRYPNVSFKHWLTTIDGEDWRERASDYDEYRQKGSGSSYMYRGDAGEVLTYDPSLEYKKDEEMYLIQSLAHLHTGRIEDLVRIVEDIEPDAQYTQPYEAYRSMTPEGGQMNREEYINFREQGSQPLPPR